MPVRIREDRSTMKREEYSNQVTFEQRPHEEVRSQQRERNALRPPAGYDLGRRLWAPGRCRRDAHPRMLPHLHSDDEGMIGREANTHDLESSNE